jgi:hypothetical protein
MLEFSELSQLTCAAGMNRHELKNRTLDWSAFEQKPMGCLESAECGDSNDSSNMANGGMETHKPCIKAVIGPKWAQLSQESITRDLVGTGEQAGETLHCTLCAPSRRELQISLYLQSSSTGNASCDGCKLRGSGWCDWGAMAESQRSQQ